MERPYTIAVYGRLGAEMFAENGGWENVQQMMEELGVDNVNYWWPDDTYSTYRIPADATKVTLKGVINYIMGHTFIEDIEGYQRPGKKDVAWIPWDAIT